MSFLPTFLQTCWTLVLCCCFVISNVAAELLITDLVVGFPGNNTICIGSTTALTLDGYLSNINDYLRLRSELRLFVLVDDEVTEVRRVFDQPIDLTFRFFGTHTIHARVCHELDCVSTSDPTYVITRPGYGMNHCSGRMAWNLPYISDIPATATLTGVIVNHLLSNTPADENGHYIPIAIPSQLSQTSVAVCMIVNGYLILPEQGNNYRDRCFIHDNVTAKVQIDAQRSYISMLFIEMNSYTVVVRTDYYVVPPLTPDEATSIPLASNTPSYQQPTSSQPMNPIMAKSRKESTKSRSASLSARADQAGPCRGLRVIGLYDGALSEGFYWHDSGLHHLMSLVMAGMKRKRAGRDGNAAICSVRLLVVMDPTLIPHTSTATAAATSAATSSSTTTPVTTTRSHNSSHHRNNNTTNKESLETDDKINDSNNKTVEMVLS